MRWPWHRHHEGPEETGALEALVRAHDRLNEDRARWSEIIRLDDALGRVTRRNHFSEAIEAIIRGNKA